MKSLKEVMSQNVQCIGPHASLRDVADKMKALDSGAIPVCENERLLGMVTDRDIVLKAIANGQDPDKVMARDVMSSPIVYCFEDQDVGEAARIMEAQKVRRLVVLNQKKNLVGIVSIGDLSLRGGNEALVGEILEKVAEPGGKHSSSMSA